MRREAIQYAYIHLLFQDIVVHNITRTIFSLVEEDVRTDNCNNTHTHVVSISRQESIFNYSIVLYIELHINTGFIYIHQTNYEFSDFKKKNGHAHMYAYIDQHM